ncbi:HesA/MoeB/ThiF family protein [Jatrophihabitans lederbergiae]|uniref:ThiF family adenylyltransferase n=1 Tax=Jatrophihabitans lederbergiae TaxID=3075547 RepID=A0ABU2JGS1_9ACTN|nr:ThiF family adenylyltransferase [Jatrophihabitans sp. DSM 44399]MDT0264191.1 ThiF family adenylyltransferase [Jatrophihabitans sp. DSM 44399]
MTGTPILGSAPAIALKAGEGLWAEVTAHVLAPDGDEHGGALLCGLARNAKGETRLLARRFVPAIDGTDYVPGSRGYRALTPQFIRRVVRLAAEQRLVCLFVHGHGSGDSVDFSGSDLASHERGYQALLDISQQIVGALVLASKAIAGDIWIPGQGRAEVHTTIVVGANLTRLAPQPVGVHGHRFEDDRQTRLFGDLGQHILRGAKIGVIGTGGAGMLAIEWLSRLGVGEVVAIDPDRVDLTNLTRLPGATRRDALSLLTSPGRPNWLRALGRRRAAPKIRVAQRLAKTAGQGTMISGFVCNVTDHDAAHALTDCDYLVLAADTATARHLVNIISHQYLIPMIQVGVKIPVDKDGGVGDLFAAIRPVTPEAGCLRCAGLIDANQLAVESLPDPQRRQADYGTGQPAPSVIALNATAVSEAITRLMFALTGLNQTPEILHVRHHARRGNRILGEPRRDSACPVCGVNGVVGLGDLQPLPLPRT